MFASKRAIQKSLQSEYYIDKPPEKILIGLNREYSGWVFQ